MQNRRTLRPSYLVLFRLPDLSRYNNLDMDYLLIFGFQQTSYVHQMYG